MTQETSIIPLNHPIIIPLYIYPIKLSHQIIPLNYPLYIYIPLNYPIKLSHQIIPLNYPIIYISHYKLYIYPHYIPIVTMSLVKLYPKKIPICIFMISRWYPKIFLKMAKTAIINFPHPHYIPIISQPKFSSRWPNDSSNISKCPDTEASTSTKTWLVGVVCSTREDTVYTWDMSEMMENWNFQVYIWWNMSEMMENIWFPGAHIGYTYGYGYYWIKYVLFLNILVRMCISLYISCGILWYFNMVVKHIPCSNPTCLLSVP